MCMNSIEKGIIYITTGSDYAREAETSARSLKTACPGLNATIFTSDDVDESLFDNVIKIKNEHGSGRVIKSDKIKYMLKSPYEKTVFLDSDTYIVHDFSGVFSLLDRFDLAAAHAPARINDKKSNNNIPLSFPEINTGVIVFKKNPRVKKLFKLWEDEFKKDLALKKENDDHPLDQPSFRRSLYAGDVRFSVLTPEYNCRFISPGYAWGKVFILHGRHSRLDYVAKRLNSNNGRKIFFLKSRRSLIFRIRIFMKNMVNEMGLWFY